MSLNAFVRDVRYAVRMLRRTPGLTAVAVLILALGIGANTAIFSLVSAITLRPLPFVEPERLVVLWEDYTAIGGPPFGEPALPNLLDWQARSRSFEDVAIFENRTYNLTDDGEPERLAALRTTPNLPALLGIQPLAGRTFLPGEAAESAPVALISEELWIRRFGAAPTVVGRDIVLDGVPHTVLGVVPRDFRTLRTLNPDVDVWVPTAFAPAELAMRGAHYLYAIGRLAPGASIETAQSEANVIASSLREEHPSNRGMELTVSALHEQLARDSRPALRLLLGGVAILLLIACANVANLLLARGAAREREIALRKSLGAGHGRLLRQLLTESAVLAALGVVLGVLLAAASFGYLEKLIPATFPSGTAPSLDARVLAFTATIGLGTVLLFGAGPALRTARTGLNDTMKRGAMRGGSRHGGKLRNALAVAEIALTLVLLMAGGLLLRSYTEVLAADPGFRAENLLVAETALSGAQYSEMDARTAFYERVLERARALPGVTHAGYTTYPPLLFKGGRALIFPEGQPIPPPDEILRNLVVNRASTAGYFEALGVPLVRGRLFDTRDTPQSAPVAVINRALAEKLWPDADPIGRGFFFGPQQNPQRFTIVGIVEDVRQMGLDVSAEPEVHLHANQIAEPAPFNWPRHLVLRTAGDPLALAAAVRRAVRDVDADQPIAKVQAMSEVFDAELASRNTQLTLVGAFAVLALVLAAAGIYGVLSYSVALRAPEIGLRMALGAQRGAVLGAIVRDALVLAGVGLALGIGGALAITRVLTSFLYGVSPADPLTFAASAVLLLLVTGVAAFLPARRAANVDPMTALRDE